MPASRTVRRGSRDFLAERPFYVERSPAVGGRRFSGSVGAERSVRPREDRGAPALRQVAASHSGGVGDESRETEERAPHSRKEQGLPEGEQDHRRPKQPIGRSGSV